jgi:predicted metal-dependent peptidase
MPSLPVTIKNMLLEDDLAFYGLFLSEINKEIRNHPQIKTACIATDKDSTSRMIINPEFWEGLTEKEQFFILAHECVHYMHSHYMLYDLGWDKGLINIATDLSINSRLVKYNSNSCSMPVDKNGKITGLLPSNSYPEFNLEEDKDAKYYYDILKEKKEEKEKSKERGEDDPNKEPGNGEGTSGSAQFDQDLENAKEIHGTWDEITEGMTESEKEVLKRSVQNQIEKLVEEYEKNRGTLPAELRDYLKSKIVIKKPVVSWKNIFRQFASRTISKEIKSTRNRPNRRFGSLFPAIKYKYTTSIICGVDQSGSMSEYDLEQCNHEIYHMWKADANVEQFPWDGSAMDPKEYKGQLVFERYLGGGTNIDCAIEKINETGGKHTMGVVLTDGYIGGAYVKSKIPVIIVITKNGTKDFENPHKYKVVQIQ